MYRIHRMNKTKNLKKSGIAGLFAGSLDVAKEFVSKGAECFTYGSDLEFLDEGTKISFENLHNSMK